jgi:hypothetical protein
MEFKSRKTLRNMGVFVFKFKKIQKDQKNWKNRTGKNEGIQYRYQGGTKEMKYKPRKKKSGRKKEQKNKKNKI